MSKGHEIGVKHMSNRSEQQVFDGDRLLLTAPKQPLDKLWPLDLRELTADPSNTRSSVHNAVRHVLDADFVAFTHASL